MSFFSQLFGRNDTLAAERFNLIAQSFQDGVWTITYAKGEYVNPDTKTWWSERFYEIIGYTEAEFMTDRESLVKIMHPDDAVIMRDALMAHANDASGRTHYDVIYRLRMKSGEYRVFNSRCATQRNSAGRPVQSVGFIRDITDYRKQIDEREFLLKRLEFTEQSGDEGIWDMTVVDGNAFHPKSTAWYSGRYCEILGYSQSTRNEMAQNAQGWSDTVHPDDRPELERVFTSYLSDKNAKTPFRVDVRQRKRNGEYLWTATSGLAIRNENGIVTRIIGGSRDITAEHERGEYERRLGEVVSDISEVVRNLYASLQAISKEADSIATGARSQASQVSSVAVSIEEMTQTSQENTRLATRASGEAESANGTADQGGRIVGETTTGMSKIADVVMNSAKTIEELGKTSEQIGEIVQVIEEIADQTNLLALNAAIEAARAGDQGRGFAVVADEVRKLAERTQKATKEIGQTIKRIQNETHQAVSAMNAGTGEVKRGATAAEQASDALSKIISSTDAVAQIINQLASASEEQTSTSMEIARNVENISAATDRFASSTEDIRTTISQISGMAAHLQELVAGFDIGTSANTMNRSQNNGGIRQQKMLR
jgi:PAS domain S-box-containing protein